MSTSELIKAIEEMKTGLMGNPDCKEGFLAGLDVCTDLINTHMADTINQIKADGIREALDSVEHTFNTRHTNGSILGAPATVDYYALLKYARVLSTISAGAEK